MDFKTLSVPSQQQQHRTAESSSSSVVLPYNHHHPLTHGMNDDVDSPPLASESAAATVASEAPPSSPCLTSHSNSLQLDLSTPFNRGLIHGLLERAASSTARSFASPSVLTARGPEKKLIIKVNAELQIEKVYKSLSDVPPKLLLKNSSDNQISVLQLGTSYVELGPKTHWNVFFVNEPQLVVHTHIANAPGMIAQKHKNRNDHTTTAIRSSAAATKSSH